MRLILFAPNIHVGGGLVLLQSLIKCISKSKNIDSYFLLSENIRGKIPIDGDTKIYWVAPGIIGRLKSEILLKKIAKNYDTVFCFHNLPPLFLRHKNIQVYIQNILLLDFNPLNNFKFIIKFKITFERIIGYVRRHSVNIYYVQTNYVLEKIRNFYFRNNNKYNIVLAPFFDNYIYEKNELIQKDIFDFIYVADGLPHKNHMNLLTAWEILAEQGFFPSLALTIPLQFTNLVDRINKLNKRKLKIYNLGLLSHEEIINNYRNSKALIFPSLTESFGLPLIEASLQNLDIIASDLDYVFQVSNPKLVFNPNSPNSIARTVKSYMGILERKNLFLTTSEFVDVLKLNN